MGPVRDDRQAGHSPGDRRAHRDRVPGPAEQPQDEAPGDRRAGGEADERVRKPAAARVRKR